MLFLLAYVVDMELNSYLSPQSIVPPSTNHLSEEPKSFARRDRLAAMEGPAQKRWESEKVFEAKAEFNEDGSPKEKFMVTFPYPYMNGRLHLGHAYSMSKVRRRVDRLFFDVRGLIFRSLWNETVKDVLSERQGAYAKCAAEYWTCAVACIATRP